MYVTLEPCCHYGKTPPCTEAIIESGISKVVIGTLDPNPLMAGKSVDILKKHGISVEVGVLEQECRELIRVFRKYITTGRPYVLMKYAMTMDGKIATRTGASRWITGETARAHVQETRNEFPAIMVGVNTVLKDDPLLTCRMENGRNPVRIICDTHLRTPLTAKVVQTAEKIPTWIATCCKDTERKALYEKYRCRIIMVPEKNQKVDLYALMKILGKNNIDGILLEGGAALNWSALEAGVVDSVQAYLAPKIFGGTGMSAVAGEGVALPVDAIQLSNAVWYHISTEKKILRYIVEKGSIAIDGISLTVAAVDETSFSVSVIPHTLANTALVSKRVQDTVNLENDCVGKYIEKFVMEQTKPSGITKEFLLGNGF